MSSIHPFRALRPEPAQAAAVAAVPYDVVDATEARALAADDPLSFLRVSRPEIELPEDTDPHADIVYATGVRNFARLRAEAPLVQEAEPSLYVYRLRMGAHEQTGVAGCFSVDEYEADVIRKHEQTRKDKEDDRTRHILDLGAQTGPVFLTYPASAAVDAAVARTTAGAPLFDFTAVDGVQHTVWRVADGDGSRRSSRPSRPSRPCTSRTATIEPRVRCALARRCGSARPASGPSSRRIRSSPSPSRMTRPRCCRITAW